MSKRLLEACYECDGECGMEVSLKVPDALYTRSELDALLDGLYGALGWVNVPGHGWFCSVCTQRSLAISKVIAESARQTEGTP